MPLSSRAFLAGLIIGGTAGILFVAFALAEVTVPAG